MYIPNDETNASPLPGPTELDTQVNEFISTAAKEFAIEEPSESAPALETTESVSPAPSEPAPTAAPAPSGTVSDPADRGLERLVAREVELREREARLSGAEAEMAALKTRLRELEPRAITQEQLDNIRLSPAEGLRALGLDPDEVIRQALVQKLGDKADPQLKEMLERTRLQKEMMALKAQVQEAERRQAAQAYYASVANGAQGYLSKVEELSKHAPTVAHVAKTAPERAYLEIMDEITRDAATRARQEPNGDIISYEEAAKRVEARWSGLKKMLGVDASGNPVSASTPSVPSAGPAPETKPNVGQKSGPAKVTPPEKPLAPWLRASKDEEDAIRAAIAEWQRSESR